MRATGAYLSGRLLHSALVIVGVSVIVFVLTRLSGDPVALMLPADARIEDIQRLREDLGLNRPIWEQYAVFLGRALQLDFGTSLRHRQPAMELVLERVPATIELTIAALLASLIVAIPLGIVAATRRNSIFDGLSMITALFGQCAPTFWLGIMLILIVSVQLRLLPSSGRGGIEYLILPAITLGSYSAALITRLLRSNLLEVLNRDYVRTARAKGLAEWLVIGRHALKNAAIPVVTVVGLQIGTLIGGAIITETVFSYPGMGLLAIQAIRNRDFPVIQAFVVCSALVIVVINFVVDMLYYYLDPRVSYK